MTGVGFAHGRGSWPSQRRLRRRRDFVAARGGTRLHTRNFAIQVVAAAGMERIGITVSRRVGNAVVRNRIKRWVREFARRQPVVFDRDVVVIARPSASKLRGAAAVAAELAPVWSRGAS